MTRRWLGGLSVLLVGCSGPDESPAEGCPTLSSATAEVEGAVEIGVFAASDFELVTEGQELPLVQGFQGGYMVTPAVRVNEAVFGTDGRCVQMDVAASVESGPEVEQHYRFAALPSSGGVWFSDTIPLFLANTPDELSGKGCTISVTWRDDDRESTAYVSVLLSFQSE